MFGRRPRSAVESPTMLLPVVQPVEPLEVTVLAALHLLREGWLDWTATRDPKVLENAVLDVRNRLMQGLPK